MAALEGALRGWDRPDRDAVPGPRGRLSLVADLREPVPPRGGGVRRGSRCGRATARRPDAAPRRVEPRGHRLRPRGPGADLALGDAALARAPRADRRARTGRRSRRLHGADEPPARNPVVPARTLRDSGRLLRRRRADEPAGVRGHGHRLQSVPRRRSGRVRRGAVELRRRSRPAAGARRAAGRGAALGRRSRALLAAAGGEASRRLLLRLRLEVPARVDPRAPRRAERAPPGGRLRGRWR